MLQFRWIFPDTVNPQLSEPKGGNLVRISQFFGLTRVVLPKKILNKQSTRASLIFLPQLVCTISVYHQHYSQISISSFCCIVKDDFLAFPGFFRHLRHGDGERNEVEALVEGKLELASVNTGAALDLDLDLDLEILRLILSLNVQHALRVPPSPVPENKRHTTILCSG